MVVHYKSRRQGVRAGLGGGMCACVNEVVAAAHGDSFDASSTVGCKKKEEHFCKQGIAREQHKASPDACMLGLDSCCSRRNALESVPSFLSRLISSVLQRNCEQFLVSPASMCSN